MRNPFRSEADAFRLLVIVGVAAAGVIVVALVAGSLPGALVGLVLLCVGGVYAWRWTRAAVAAPRKPED